MHKLLMLLALYFAQGLPFGFQATALPLMLRERGESLQTIGFAGLLSTPWMLKALWAPWVDRYGSVRLGRRKSWIVPMQIGLVGCALLAAQVAAQPVLFAVLFAMNVFAATQDIAVDGLAVSWLSERELGPGNAVQVVGYKLGMLSGGGLLLWASTRLQLGWSGLFQAMAGLLALVLILSISMREPRVASPAGERMTFAQIGAALKQALAGRATVALISVVLTYKTGETLANMMWNPMLLDRGFPIASVGVWTGTFGMLCSLCGSFGSGFLVRHVRPARALIWIGLFRGLGVAAQWWLSVQSHPSASDVIAVTCIEHLFSGALTTVMFTMMMRHSQREIGATHYTLLASLEVWGKAPLTALSGVIALNLGYPVLYATGSALCFAFTALAFYVRPRLDAASVQAT